MTNNTLLGEVTGVVEGLRGRRDVAYGELTEAKVGLASEEQLLASFLRQLEPLNVRIEELKQLVAQRRSDIETGGNKKKQTEKDIVDSTQRIASVRSER